MVTLILCIILLCDWGHFDRLGILKCDTDAVWHDRIKSHPIFTKVAQRVATADFALIGSEDVQKIPRRWPYIWATFARKFVANTGLNYLNLVTLFYLHSLTISFLGNRRGCHPTSWFRLIKLSDLLACSKLYFHSLILCQTGYVNYALISCQGFCVRKKLPNICNLKLIWYYSKSTLNLVFFRPRLWSSGQRARLLLRQVEFESRSSL